MNCETIFESLHLTIQLSLTATDDDRKKIGAGLDAFNKFAAPLDEVVPLDVIARENSEIIGGAIGRTWGACCELLNLWVHDQHRRRGIGTQLMQAFESAAVERKCRLMYLDTFSFQSPEFYQSIGCEVVAEFDGFGHGIRRFILQKSIG